MNVHGTSDFIYCIAKAVPQPNASPHRSTQNSFALGWCAWAPMRALLPAAAARARARLLWSHTRRAYCPEGKLDAGADDVAEMLEGSVDRSAPVTRDAPGAAARLLTTRREALSLYREILRYSLLFVWRDERGVPWREVIRRSARQEFEASREEQDPEILNRLIITGRDAVQRTVERFQAKRVAIQREEEAGAFGGGGGGGLGGSGGLGGGGGGPPRPPGAL